jgi:hypothetical protein
MTSSASCAQHQIPPTADEWSGVLQQKSVPIMNESRGGDSEVIIRSSFAGIVVAAEPGA